MKLNEIKEQDGATRNRKRVGRGIGSGRGKTSGSGHKGQKARSGVSINGFEGGQMPIHRRLPKRGFNNIFRKNYVEVNLDRIQRALDAGSLDKKKPVDVAALVTAGVISKPRDGVRVLANGVLKDKIEIHAAGASKAAVAAIEKAGGKIVIATAQPASGHEKGKSVMAQSTQANAGFGLGALTKADDLKKRLLFTVGALIIYRLGTLIPLPGIDPVALSEVFGQQTTGILGMFDMFSGGALGRMTIFALNIMPYITASIIMQLMTAIVPTLETLKKDGEAGRKQINQYTRYLTVLLASVQGYGIAVALEAAGTVVTDPGLFFRLTTVVTLVVGTLFLMWLGEQITARGVGNGISLIIFSGIVAEVPSAHSWHA